MRHEVSALHLGARTFRTEKGFNRVPELRPGLTVRLPQEVLPMSDVFRIVNLNLHEFTDRLDRALRELVSANMAATPRARHFTETVHHARAIADAQRNTTPVLIVASCDCPWEQRERRGLLLGLDLLDISQELLDMSSTFGREFREDARRVLCFLESAYAARWCVEYIDSLLLVMNQRETGQPSAPPAASKAKRPVKVAAKKSHPAADTLIEECRALARALQREVPVTARCNEQSLIFLNSGGMGGATYSALHARFDCMGSILLQRKRQGNRRARKLLKHVIALTERMSQFAGYEQGRLLIKETHRLEALLARSTGE
jgi:hypothetical protein